MDTATKLLLAQTADDLMTRHVVRLPEEMPLRDAARLLLRNQIGGAPVVDSQGKCVGVLTAIDFLRLAEKRDNVTNAATPGMPLTCSFVIMHTKPDGSEVAMCALPPGVCPLQVQQKGPDGEDGIICNQPHCVLVDWQIVDVDNLPTGEVRRYMTANPVTSPPNTSVRTLARRMIDAHIHRIIVVDEQNRPIGIVSSTDLLAALAYAEEEP